MIEINLVEQALAGHDLDEVGPEEPDVVDVAADDARDALDAVHDAVLVGPERPRVGVESEAAQMRDEGLREGEKRRLQNANVLLVDHVDDFDRRGHVGEAAAVECADEGAEEGRVRHGLVERVQTHHFPGDAFLDGLDDVADACG